MMSIENLATQYNQLQMQMGIAEDNIWLKGIDKLFQKNLPRLPTVTCL